VPIDDRRFDDRRSAEGSAITQWLITPVERIINPNSGAGGHQVLVGQPTRHRGDVRAMSPGMQALVWVIASWPRLNKLLAKS
jgi:hypothetical protein